MDSPNLGRTGKDGNERHQGNGAQSFVRNQGPRGLRGAGSKAEMRIGRGNEHRFLRLLGLRVSSVGRQVGDLSLEDTYKPSWIAVIRTGKIPVV